MRRAPKSNTGETSGHVAYETKQDAIGRPVEVYQRRHRAVCSSMNINKPAKGAKLNAAGLEETARWLVRTHNQHGIGIFKSLFKCDYGQEGGQQLHEILVPIWRAWRALPIEEQERRKAERDDSRMATKINRGRAA